MKTLYKYLPIFAILSLVACGDDSSSTSSNGNDPESSSEQADISSSSGKTGTEDPSDIFSVRKPDQKAYICNLEVMDIHDTLSAHDMICTFKYEKMDGFIYIQGTPSSCEGFMQALPVIENPKIELYVNGDMVKVTKPAYDWGGNHHVDEISFEYDGKKFAYNHSSMGFGWRPCQEMDCLKVYSDKGDLIKDGCGEDRTLPIVCKVVDKDGKFGTFEDKFKVCDGDERLLEDEADSDE